MKFPVLTESDPNPLPMTLEQYLDFCDFSMQFSRPDRIRKQKEWEEEIAMPFRLLNEEIEKATDSGNG